ncbi:MAG: acyl-CoA dehydrogenase family protein [Spirochaetaceae bacterium]|nr:acyl-CoA dehydrogenase family protein [Spirochaetaceae bacterium]
MGNFLHDNEDILFHLEHLDLDRVIELKEMGFADKDSYAHAPQNIEDAKDSYMKVLDIVGELCGDYLAPQASEIDEEGVKLIDGEVQYAKGTAEVLDLFAKADLMGFALPRKYGGLNMPTTMTTIAAEMVMRADGSFLNFGLQQDIGETINKFASEDQKMEFLPKLCTGEHGSSMILTEPDAGSDLPAVALRAYQDKNGQWFLHGVKRFITNGNGEIGLVLARSEDASGARGLSQFIYKRDDKMVIRRLEDKLGIHGSPTCELQFNDAPCVLMGERGRGLIKYTMWLMNSARLGIGAQAVGIAEAAYREADKYASEREQFGTDIRSMVPVYEMLTEMKVAIEAGRSLLYETATVVDIKEGLEHMAEAHPEKAKELKSEIKKYTRLAGLLTPMVKAYNTEMCNKVAYDAIQIHGGTGFMREFNVERHSRDARITNIYEGTTQLQIVAAIGGVTSGTAMDLINEMNEADFSFMGDSYKLVLEAKEKLAETIALAKASDNKNFITYHSRRLVEMAIALIQSYLLMRDARHSDRKKKVAQLFIEKTASLVEHHKHFITDGRAVLLDHYKDIIG